MTVDEFNNWLRYDKQEPFHGTDIEIAQLTMLAASFMGAKNVAFSDFYVHSQDKDQVPGGYVGRQDNTDLEDIIMKNYGGQ